ncbi:MAG: PHP domain-containing protein [Candidatus Pacearchaeota archaeon]
MRFNFKRFNDLKEEDINFDFQMHTCWTDGKNTVQEMIEQSKKLGLKSIALTEHVNYQTKWYNNFVKEIKKLREKKKYASLEIFIGAEIKPVDYKGSLGASDFIINESEIVIGSIHRYPEEKGGFISLDKIPILGLERAADIEFRLSIGLIKNKRIDVLGHPFGVYSKYFTGVPEDYLKEIMQTSLKNGVAVEINTKYNLGSEVFFKLLREINPYVSIGSDAHSVDEIARGFEIIKKEISK